MQAETMRPSVASGRWADHSSMVAIRDVPTLDSRPPSNRQDSQRSADDVQLRMNPSSVAAMEEDESLDQSRVVVKPAPPPEANTNTNIVTAEVINFRKAILEPMEEFLFMDPKRRCVSGLKKWTVDEWDRRIAMHPRKAAEVVKSLVLTKGASLKPMAVTEKLPVYPGTHVDAARALKPQDWEEVYALLKQGVSDLGEHKYTDLTGRAGSTERRMQLARDLRQKLAEASRMSDWEAVMAFQNVAQNYERGEGDQPHTGPPGSAAARREEEALHMEDEPKYLEQSVLSQMVFDREFPLGVEETIMQEDRVYRFAIQHSGGGCHRVRHHDSNILSTLIYVMVLAGIIFFFFYLFYRMYGQPDQWTIEGTIQDVTVPGYSELVKNRGQQRGRVASLLNSMTFSLLVNASLDKFGLIDPSTSTVLVGMTLGGTWGFVLDNMLGTDEGFREYLWSPISGMMYGMGCLYTQRFGRYVVTILFDMFFTVILFKQLYSRLVQAAGFTVAGREWIANGFVSTFIAILTFEVYANMTRFQWAYPSGTEDVINQWISGPTMVLCVVIMCMVYLTAETRTRVGEPGINDPSVKMYVTAFTFVVLLVLSQSGYIDPSDVEPANSKPRPAGTLASDPYNVHLPLKSVCAIYQGRWYGMAIFFSLAFCCLAFVIFVTSAQSLSGLAAACCCCLASKAEAMTQSQTSQAQDSEGDGEAPPARASMRQSIGASLAQSARPQRVSLPGTGGLGGDSFFIGGQSSILLDEEQMHRKRASVTHHRGVEQTMHRTNADKTMGKCLLFLVFNVATFLIVLLFTLHPVYQVDPKWGPRNTTLWEEACLINYDKAALANLGLS